MERQGKKHNSRRSRSTPVFPLSLFRKPPQDKAAVLADVRSIISEQLGTELDKVRLCDRRSRGSIGDRARAGLAFLGGREREEKKKSRRSLITPPPFLIPPPP